MEPVPAGEFLIALALVLVIEGAVYALFPEAMKRMMLTVAAQRRTRGRDHRSRHHLAAAGLNHAHAGHI
jgi:Uncharacterized protein conserved in bacteria (DUF2065)